MAQKDSQNDSLFFQIVALLPTGSIREHFAISLISAFSRVSTLGSCLMIFSFRLAASLVLYGQFVFRRSLFEVSLKLLRNRILGSRKISYLTCVKYTVCMNTIKKHVNRLMLDPNNYRFRDSPAYTPVDEDQVEDDKIQQRTFENLLVGRNYEQISTWSHP